MANGDIEIWSSDAATYDPATFYTSGGTFCYGVDPMSTTTNIYSSRLRLHRHGVYTKVLTIAEMQTIASAPNNVGFAPAPPVVSVVPGLNQGAATIYAHGNGLPVTSYTYTIDNGVTTTTTSSPTFPVSGLTNGQPYTLRVAATNANGVGTYGSTTFIPIGAPAAMAQPVITAGILQLTVSAYTAPVDNGSAITGYFYTLYKGLTSTSLAIDASNTLVARGSTAVTSFTISNLTGGFFYSLVLHAANAMGNSIGSAQSAAVMVIGPPSTPILTLQPAGTSVSVYYDCNTNGAAVSTLKYVYSTTAINTASATYTSVTTTANPYTITGLVNGTNYTLAVKLTNAAGDSPPSVVTPSFSSFLPLPVASAPTITSVVPGNGGLVVSFTAGANTGNPLLGYTYSLNYGTGSATPFIFVSGTTSPLTIYGLTSGTAYTVTMKAVTAAGSSAVSTTSASVTLISTPFPPVVSAISTGTSGQAVVSFVPGESFGQTVTYTYALSTAPTTWVAVTPSNNVFTISSLTNGSSYTIQLKASASGLSSAASASSAAFVPYGSPAAPTALSVVPGDKVLQVSFAAPSSTNGAGAVVSYNYKLNNQGNGFQVETDCLGATSLVIFNVTNGVAYTVQLQTVAANGALSAWSSASTSVTPYGLPSMPTLNGIDISYGFVTVRATPGASNGSAWSKYTYYLDGTTPVDVSSSSSSFVINSPSTLTLGTQHFLALRQSNAAGASSVTAPTSFYMYGAPSAPQAISIVTKSQEVLLYVSSIASNGDEVDNFQYSYSADGVNFVTATVAASSVANPDILYNKVFLIDISSGLINDLSYSLTVRAQNEFGWGPASTVKTFVPEGVPDAPTITGVEAGDHQITVSFVDGSDNGAPITGHQYSTDNGVTWLTAVSSTSPIICYGLNNNQSYTIKMKTVNVLGASLSSAASAAAVPYGAPFPPVVTNVETGPLPTQARIYFSPIDNNGSAITSLQFSLGASAVEVDVSLNPTLSSPVLITGLTPKTFYSGVGLLATNIAGQSRISNTRPITGGAPLTPYLVSLTPSPTTVTMVVKPNAPSVDPTGSTLAATTKYNIVDGCGNAIKNASFTATTPDASGNLTFVLSGLANGTRYAPYVSATNSAGVSPFSNRLPSVQPGDVPTVPKILLVSALFNRVMIKFSAPATLNGAALVKYQYLFSGASSQWEDVSSGAFFHLLYPSNPATGLFTDSSGTMLLPANNNVNYGISIRAVNGYGVSPAASSPNALLYYTYLPPAVMAAPVVTATYKQLSVVFKAPLANGAEITSYWYAVNGSTTYLQAVDASGRPQLASPLILKKATSTEDISFNIDYTVSLYAVNSAGAAAASPFSAVGKGSLYPYTPPLAGPVLSTAFATDQEVQLSFALPKINNARIVGYAAYYTAVATGTTLQQVPAENVIVNTANVDAAGNVLGPVRVTGLTNDVSYSLVLAAVGSEVGVSTLKSAKPIVATPVWKVPGVPVIKAIDLSSNGQVRIQYTPGAINGSPITDYRYTVDGSLNSVALGSTAPILFCPDLSAVPADIAIAARNAVGWSNWTYTVPLKFAAPPTVTAPSFEILDISFAPLVRTNAWTPGAPITSYKYILSTASNELVDTGATATRFTVDISNNRMYMVAVVAANAAGNNAPSAFSKAPGVQYIYTPPPLGPVLGPSAVTGTNHSVTVPLVAPVTAVSNAVITGYKGRFVPVVGASFELVATSFTSTSATFTNNSLVNDTSYSILLAAGTDAGYSPLSVKAVVGTPVFKIPGVPVITAVTVGTDGSLNIAFVAPLANGSPISGYDYTLDGGVTTASATVTSATLLAIPELGVVPSHIAIRAQNAVGPSAWTFTAFAATMLMAPALTVSLNALDVSFAAPAPKSAWVPGAPLTGYVYRVNNYALQTAASTASPLHITSVDGVNDVSYNVPYNISMAAVNAAGTGAFFAAKVGTYIYVVPKAAPKVTGVVGSNESLAVSVTAPDIMGTNAPVTGYSVVLNGASGEPITISSTTSPLVLSSLTNDVSYSVIVAAITPVGLSAYSAPAVVGRTVWRVPPTPVVTAWEVSNNQVKMTFVPSTVWQGSALQKYQLTLDGGATFDDISGLVPPLVYTLPTPPGQVYQVGLYGVNGAGRSANPTSFVSLAGPNVLGPVAAVAVTVAKPVKGTGAQAAAYSIVVTVAKGTNPVNVAFTGYRYQLVTSGSPVNNDSEAWTSVTGLATATTIAALPLSATRTLYVQGVNAAGASPTASVAVVIPSA